MTEDRIRSQTAVILEAYRELTGFDIIPDVSEFIAFRREAVNELAEDMPKKKVPLQKRPVQAPRRENPVRTEQNAPKPVKQEKKPPAAGRQQEPKKPEKHTEPEDREEKEMTDYEILRRIKDPWN